MANGLSDIVRQINFLQAGGGRDEERESLAEGFKFMSQVPLGIAQIRRQAANDAIARKRASLENIKLERELSTPEQLATTVPSPAVAGTTIGRPTGQITTQRQPDIRTGGFTLDESLKVKRLMDDESKDSPLFPIAGLTEEAQVKAFQAGFKNFVTEPQARILQAGTLPKAATSEEIKDIANFETMTRQFSRASELFDLVGNKAVGPVRSVINKAGQYSPIPGIQTDPDVVEFYQQLNDINNQIIYLRSGKQINENEYQRLKATFPTPNLNTVAFKRRLDTFTKTFDDIKRTRRGAIEGAGRRLNVPGTTGSQSQGTTSSGNTYILEEIP